MIEKKLYKPFVSKAKNKKYSVYVKGSKGNPRLIHFGDKRYEQYKDKIGHYSRHGNATSKDTAKYWSHKILW